MRIPEFIVGVFVKMSAKSLMRYRGGVGGLGQMRVEGNMLHVGVGEQHVVGGQHTVGGHDLQPLLTINTSELGNSLFCLTSVKNYLLNSGN